MSKRNSPALLSRRARGAALVLTGCSSSGGKQVAQSAADAGAAAAGTPRLKIAMIKHATPGDTFWDVVRKGAEAAAKDNVDLAYSGNPAGPNQANLVQHAIDQKVDGIAVTLPPGHDGRRGRQGQNGRHPGRRVQRRSGQLGTAGTAGVLRLGRDGRGPGLRRPAQRRWAPSTRGV
jgi:hypothetical protein